MRLTRYLKPPQVKLELNARTPEEVPEGWSLDRLVWSVKTSVLEELTTLFEASGKVVNPRKLFTDLENRERKATTGIGGGIAIPHVRTMQARDFTLCFARSTPGVEFGAIDGQPVHLFFGVVAPPYHDKLYLEVYRQAATIFSDEQRRLEIMAARDAHEIVKIVGSFGD